ncbi:MAG: hypothetical protein ABUS49_03125 [Acidobacteriota bacterium]
MAEDSAELIRSQSQAVLVHFLSTDLEFAGKLLDEAIRSLDPGYVEAAVENARTSLNVARRLTWRIEELSFQREIHSRIHELHAALSRYLE